MENPIPDPRPATQVATEIRHPTEDLPGLCIGRLGAVFDYLQGDEGDGIDG